jgi:hypothetical protein
VVSNLGKGQKMRQPRFDYFPSLSGKNSERVADRWALNFCYFLFKQKVRRTVRRKALRRSAKFRANPEESIARLSGKNQNGRKIALPLPRLPCLHSGMLVLPSHQLLPECAPHIRRIKEEREEKFAPVWTRCVVTSLTHS